MEGPTVEIVGPGIGRSPRGGGDPLPAALFPDLSPGVEWGLERSLSALGGLGDPHLAVPTIHVGGTNGKGSVAATLSAVLRRAGFSVGLYTSPHLCSFRERFQIDGIAVDDDRLMRVGSTLAQVVAENGLTFFEASTVLAFQLFARRRVDVAVIEVGLGGRLDATNVVRPMATGVTNIGLDHADYLGDSLEEIAVEKAGIFKRGIPAFTAEQAPESLAVLRREAGATGAPLTVVDVARSENAVSVDARGTSVTITESPWGALDLWVPLPGVHQAWNVALAVGLLGSLPTEFRPGREAVLEGVSGLRWPGRTQIMRRGDEHWLFDVAHNPAGIHALTTVLDGLDLPRPLVLLAGILGDKPWGLMLPPLFNRVERAILTQPPSAEPERTWDPTAVAAAVSTPCPVEVIDDFQAAIRRASLAARGGTVVVAGSCHTVGDAFSALGVDPFSVTD